MKEVNLIISEIQSAMKGSDLGSIDGFLTTIVEAQSIVCIGAGRVGLMMSAFAKRLSHLGLNAFHISDTALPAVGENDVVIVASGSGTTSTVAILAEKAKIAGAKILNITANAHSPIADNAEYSLVIEAPHKESNSNKVKSLQPMTSLFEQSLLILADALVLRLMLSLSQSDEMMKARHNVLE